MQTKVKQCDHLEFEATWICKQNIFLPSIFRVSFMQPKHLRVFFLIFFKIDLQMELRNFLRLRRIYIIYYLFLYGSFPIGIENGHDGQSA